MNDENLSFAKMEKISSKPQKIFGCRAKKDKKIYNEPH